MTRPYPADVYVLIEEIREHPGLWLGSDSVVALRTFIEGFEDCSRRCGRELAQGNPDFHHFHRWVQGKLGQSESTMGYANMLAKVLGDDGPAFDRFVALLDEFRAQSI